MNNSTGLYQSGLAECESASGWNLAVAVGDSTAEAGDGDHNTAIALHESSASVANGGYDWNTAIATFACVADATFGSNLFDFCCPHTDNALP